MDDIATLPLEEQADAWGALDEKIMTEYFPIIPTAFRNDLFVFGDEHRQPDRRRLDRCAELQGPVRHSVILVLCSRAPRSSK